jgi:hypothetical protein
LIAKAVPWLDGSGQREMRIAQELKKKRVALLDGTREPSIAWSKKRHYWAKRFRVGLPVEFGSCCGDK